MNLLLSLLCLQQANNIKFLDVVSNRLLPRFTDKKVHGHGGASLPCLTVTGIST